MRRGGTIRAAVVGVALALAATACATSGEVSFDTAFATGGEVLTDVEQDSPLEQGGLLPPAGSANAAAQDRAAGSASPDTGAGAGSDESSGGRGDAATTPTGPKPPIKLGTILPLQGGERDFGEPILRTTQAFIDELNVRGGVAGHQLELIAYHACLLCQADARTAAQRLVEEDGVFALVNTYPMVVPFQSVIPYLVEKNVPLIQGGAFNQTSDALSPINFASAPEGLFYGRFIPEVTKRFTGATRVGLIYLDVPSATSGIPLLEREFARVGITVVRKEPIAAAEDAVTNMDSAVTRMRAAGAQTIAALDPAVLIFGRLAARRQGFDAPWVGPAAWSRLVEDGCGVTCDDLVFTDTAGLSFTDRDSPQMRQFVDVMARRYPGGELTGHTLAAWVGMQMLVHALSRVGEPDADAFLAAMESIRNLDLGTTSPLTFTPDRHLGGSNTTILKLKDGKYFRFEGPVDYGKAPPE